MESKGTSFKDRFETIGRSLQVELREAWMAREFPHRAWSLVGKSGLFRFLLVPKERLPQGLINASEAMEGFAKGSFDAGFTIPLMVHGFLALPLLARHANQYIQPQLPGFIDGSSILAFAVTEPQGGSIALDSECTLTPDEEGFLRLNGTKWHITNAPVCTHILAWAKHPTIPGELVAILLDSNSGGVKRERISTLAASSSLVGKIDFENVRVAPEQILFLGGNGKRELMALLQMERACGVFSGVGVLERLLEQSLEFASKRVIKGTPILAHQHIQRRLADMAIRLETARALADSLRNVMLDGGDTIQLASVAKITGARLIMESAIDASQLAGTYGMLEHAQNVMVLIDVLGCTVGGGTEEIHRGTIVRDLVKKWQAKQLAAAAAAKVKASQKEMA